MPDAALVVGLGNPGPEYELTRHNVGHRVLDILCARLGARLRPVKGARALAAEARHAGRPLILGRPTTYMNESGEAVGPLCRYYKVDPEDLVVVHDEIDLPLGQMRVKRGGGDAGHNGLRSITRTLGRDYLRVRVGIGRPAGSREAVDHVLSRFGKSEEAELAIVLDEAADAALALLEQPLQTVQNRYHAPREDPAAPSGG